MKFNKQNIKPMEEIASNFPETKDNLVFEMRDVDKMAADKTPYEIMMAVANGKSLNEQRFDPECKYVATMGNGNWISLKNEVEKHHWLLWLLRIRLENKLDDVWEFMDKKFGDKAQEYYDMLFPRHPHA